MSKRKGYYDKVGKVLGDGKYVYFVGQKTMTADIREGYKVEPYEATDTDRVTVTLPQKSRVKTWPDEKAQVNWSSMGSRDPDLALDYARLITRAAKYAAAKQAEYDKNEGVAE